MSATIAVEADEWVRRIGPDAAKARSRRAKLLVWAWCLVPVTAAIYAGLIVDIVLTVSRGSGVDIGIILLLGFVGAFAFLGALFCALLASSSRFQMEGAALRVLQAQVPGLTAYELGRQLRSASRFDRWARDQGVNSPDPSSGGMAPGAAGVVTPWSPGMTRPILRGPSSSGIFRAIWPAFTGFLVLCMTGSILGLNGIRGVLGATLFVAGISCLLCTALCAVAGLVRRRTEYRHGYVTAVTKTRTGNILDVRIGVDLVDPKTGLVIRPAGASAISGATYRARIQAIRATHSDTEPQRLR